MRHQSGLKVSGLEKKVDLDENSKRFLLYVQKTESEQAAKKARADSSFFGASEASTAASSSAPKGCDGGDKGKGKGDKKTKGKAKGDKEGRKAKGDKKGKGGGKGGKGKR